MPIILSNKHSAPATERPQWSMVCEARLWPRAANWIRRRFGRTRPVADCRAV